MTLISIAEFQFRYRLAGRLAARGFTLDRILSIVDPDGGFCNLFDEDGDIVLLFVDTEVTVRYQRGLSKTNHTAS